MASKYACRRCLAGFQKLRAPSSVPTLSGPALRRWHSSKPANSTPIKPLSTSSVRQASSHSKEREDVTDVLGDIYARPRLNSNNLFYPLSQSPMSDMRKRAAFMRAHAYCPHPSHNRTRIANNEHDPELRKPASGGLPPAHVNFECPDCGIPVACSEEHWAEDYESHMEVCDVLRQANEDEHDLRSGRRFDEFDFPGPHIEEQLINLTNWDTLLYTRQFKAIDDERQLRQATKLLTYPYTIASVLHELSPYNIRTGGRLTVEGLRSVSALRYNLHPPLTGLSNSIKDIKKLKPSPPPMRVFVIGARAESSLPREAWVQLAYMFDPVKFHIIMIGPESMTNRDDEFPLPDRTPRNPFGAVVEGDISRVMKISTYVDYYHTLHEAQHFVPYDPYFDVFVLFHPGLGHPSSSHEWAETVPMLLETKCPIIVTGYTEWDLWRDVNWVNDQVGGEMDILLEPGENRFRSLRWDINDLDPMDISSGNWGVWAFRGKRYEAQKHEPGVIKL